MFSINIDLFRVPEGLIEAAPSGNERASGEPTARPEGPPLHKPGEWFLRGPMPGGWILQAMACGLNGLRVSILLWLLANKDVCASVSLSNVFVARFGITRFQKYSGLAALENAQLISVSQRPGAAPLITLLAAPPLWCQRGRTSPSSTDPVEGDVATSASGRATKGVDPGEDEQLQAG